MLIIRAETERDYGPVAAVNVAAFGRPIEAPLVEELRKSPRFIPELSLVAILDDAVVRHILFTPVTIDFCDCPRGFPGRVLTGLSPACYIKGG